MTARQQFSSESVSCGHPDKIADQISDAVLDAILAQDPDAHVACEVLLKNSMILLAGEINTHAWVDVEALARKVVEDIGYAKNLCGFDAGCLAVLNAIGRQSVDIAKGVEKSNPKYQGAGDQGLMFGFACDETAVFMPAPIMCAHSLMRQHRQVLHEKKLAWIGPDAKAQVAFEYENAKPIAISSIVLSTQHVEDIAQAQIQAEVLEYIIRPVIPEHLITNKTKFLVNPSGRFVCAGPVADCGLTGRKIIVDTYGGMARHGGGCFSGKDPSKVDRSGAYMARYIAKHIVAAKLATRCEVQLAYAIGVADPTSVRVDTFGSSAIDDAVLAEKIRSCFDLTPYGIIERLDLKKPIYQQTATFGHFGREDINVPWERLDAITDVQSW